jgi:hypothetical protein
VVELHAASVKISTATAGDSGLNSPHMGMDCNLVFGGAWRLFLDFLPGRVLAFELPLARPGLAGTKGAPSAVTTFAFHPRATDSCRSAFQTAFGPSNKSRHLSHLAPDTGRFIQRDTMGTWKGPSVYPRPVPGAAYLNRLFGWSM